MINLSNDFGDRASGLPSFEIQGMFGKLAGVSDGYTSPDQDMALNSVLDNTL